MKKTYIVLFLFFLSSTVSNIVNTSTFDILFEKLAKQKKTTEYYKRVISNIKRQLELYPFLEISQSPPQPSFDSSYFLKQNIMSALSAIDTSDSQYLYQFNKQIAEAIGKLRDLHISFASNLEEYNDIYILSPVKLRVFNISGKPKMYAVSNIKDVSYFEDGQKALDVINKNVNISIETINGISPFKFVEEFGGDIEAARNPHSTFSYKLSLISSFNLRTLYLSKEQLKKFEFTYENGKKFNTSFGVQDIRGVIFAKSKIFEDEKTNELFLEYLEKEKKKEIEKYFDTKNDGKISSFSPKKNSFEDYIDNFKTQYNLTNANIMKNSNNNKRDVPYINEENENKLNWDVICYESNEISFQCRVDSENKLNVIVLFNFAAPYYKVYTYYGRCLELFNNNNYKIVVILSLNPGGYVLSSQMMIEGIQPYLDTRSFLSFRDSGYVKWYSTNNLINGYYSLDFNRLTTDYLESNMKTEKYGSNTMKTSKMVMINENGNYVNLIRSKLTKRRKPTDILIYTDAFSFSAGSTFCKSLQNYGGAIVVGYNGNPENKKVFDSSQSPTVIINAGNMAEILGNSIMDDFKNDGTFLYQESFVPMFNKYNDTHTPLEFEIKEVDERVDIYNSYNDVYYPEYMEKANEIFTKYETSCSGINKKLTKFSDSCKFEDDPDARGGYICENNKWSTKNCGKVYCVNGRLDEVTDKCRQDFDTNLLDPQTPSTSPPPSSSSFPSSPTITTKPTKGPASRPESHFPTWAIILIIIGGIVLISVIVVISLCLCSKKSEKNTNVNYTTNSNQSLSSQSQKIAIQQTQENINNIPKVNFGYNMYQPGTI